MSDHINLETEGANPTMFDYANAMGMAVERTVDLMTHNGFERDFGVKPNLPSVIAFVAIEIVSTAFIGLTRDNKEAYRAYYESQGREEEIGHPNILDEIEVGGIKCITPEYKELLLTAHPADIRLLSEIIQKVRYHVENQPYDYFLSEQIIIGE